MRPSLVTTGASLLVLGLFGQLVTKGYNLAELGYLTPEYVYTVSLAMKAA